MGAAAEAQAKRARVIARLGHTGTGRKLLWRGSRNYTTGTDDQMPLGYLPGEEAGTGKASAGDQNVAIIGQPPDRRQARRSRRLAKGAPAGCQGRRRRPRRGHRADLH